MHASDDEIDKGLARIRRLRRTFLFILFAFVPLTVSIMACASTSENYWLVLFPVALFFAGMGVQHRLHTALCPRCHAPFFVQTVSKNNYTPLSSISFPPQKRCQNCKLILYH